MDKMTLAVKKNIAIVPVFNLCNMKTIRFLFQMEICII